MTQLALLLNINDNLVENCLADTYDNDVCRYDYWNVWAYRILMNIIEIDKLI